MIKIDKKKMIAIVGDLKVDMNDAQAVAILIQVIKDTITKEENRLDFQKGLLDQLKNINSLPAEENKYEHEQT